MFNCCRFFLFFCLARGRNSRESDECTHSDAILGAQVRERLHVERKNEGKGKGEKGMEKEREKGGVLVQYVLFSNKPTG